MYLTSMKSDTSRQKDCLCGLLSPRVQKAKDDDSLKQEPGSTCGCSLENKSSVQSEGRPGAHRAKMVKLTKPYAANIKSLITGG